LNGALFTPPVDCGLLPGVFRAYLLEIGQVSERIIRVDKFARCAKIFLANSVRKWKEVKLAENH
jgi:para-aminobenzoate synthetase / 4-amino-4-deoxychorismate lyase